MRRTTQTTFILIVTVFVFVTGGCLDNNFISNRIEGNREPATQSRTLAGSFDGVMLAGDFTVIVTPFTRDSIQLKAESNILPYIETEIQAGKLVLRTTRNTSLHTHYPVIIHIFARNISSLDISGSGTIEADSIHTTSLSINISGSGSVKSPVYADHLETSVSGSGDIEVWGIVNDSKYTISGSGSIKAYLLLQQNSLATISGSGNIYVSVWQSLNVSISGSGSVYYKGNPKISVQISGSGRIIPG